MSRIVGQSWRPDPMLRAEWRVVTRRWSGGATAVVSIVLGLMAVALMLMIQRMGGEGGLTFNGTPVEQIVTVSGPDAAAWALRIRQFFVLPVLLLFATGGAVAAERADHTLRERLVQPVSRDRVLGIKFVSLMGLACASLLCTLVPSLGLGSMLFGVDGDWSGVLLGYLASTVTDMGVIALGLALSMLVRSAGAVVVIGLLFLAMDWGARLGLGLLSMLGVEAAGSATGFLFGTGLGAWSGFDGGWSISAFVNLAIWSVLFLVLARFGLKRIDVP